MAVFAGPLRFNRYLVAVVAVLITGWGVVAAYQSYAIRSVRLCAVSDYAFRSQQPNWEHQMKVWFSELNRVFEPAGVRWEYVYRGDAYPERTEGSLNSRRALIEETLTCEADVIVAFSGQPDTSNASVSPFSRTVVVATNSSDSDAMIVTLLTRAMAHLFGVPTDTQTLISTATPQDGILSTASLDTIWSVRHYPFNQGIAALPGSWEGRIVEALTKELAATSPNPARDAHLIIARAFMGGRKYQEAIKYLRRAIGVDVSNASLRIELAVALNDNSQHDEAIQELRRASKIDSSDARPHAAIGAILLNTGGTTEAIDEFRMATSLDPHNAEYQFLLGRALLPQVGAVDEAAAAFRAALRLKSRRDVAGAALATIESAPQVMRETLQKLEADVRQQPVSSAAHLELGLALAQAANTARARSEIARSIQLDPRNGRAHAAMAQLQYMAGDYDGAESSLQSAESGGEHISSSFLSTFRQKLGRQ